MQKIDLYGIVGLFFTAATLGAGRLAPAHSRYFMVGLFIVGLVLIAAAMVWRKRAREQGTE
jgi:hypothetical protein